MLRKPSNAHIIISLQISRAALLERVRMPLPKNFNTTWTATENRRALILPESCLNSLAVTGPTSLNNLSDALQWFAIPGDRAVQPTRRNVKGKVEGFSQECYGGLAYSIDAA